MEITYPESGITSDDIEQIVRDILPLEIPLLSCTTKKNHHWSSEQNDMFLDPDNYHAIHLNIDMWYPEYRHMNLKSMKNYICEYMTNSIFSRNYKILSAVIIYKPSVGYKKGKFIFFESIRVYIIYDAEERWKYELQVIEEEISTYKNKSNYKHHLDYLLDIHWTLKEKPYKNPKKYK